MHELRGIERRAERHRHREQQRIERSFERAEQERSQRKLGFEIVGATGGLPDILWTIVSLVPNLPEQSAKTHLRVRTFEIPPQQPPRGIRGDDAVRLRCKADRRQSSPCTDVE